MATRVNLRNSCDQWDAVPANDTLKSPVSALLLCSNTMLKQRKTWLSLQIMCLPKTAEPQTDATPETNAEDVEDILIPLGQKEMLFFDLPRIGVTSVVKYDFDIKDWSYREKEPLAPLFRSLINGRSLCGCATAGDGPNRTVALAWFNQGYRAGCGSLSRC